MKAILLAAGFGSRLKPYTNKTPKCLMPVGGVPILEIWLKELVRLGINDILINTHYLSDQVTSYIKKSNFSKMVTIKNELVLLGTAGTLLENLNFYDGEEVMLIHADNFFSGKLDLFIQAFKKRPKESLITVLGFRTSTPNNVGILEVDSRGMITNFFEKNTKGEKGNLANGAVYIISKEAIFEISKIERKPTDFSLDVLPIFIERMNVYEIKEFYIDIGTINDYELANNMVKKNG